MYATGVIIILVAVLYVLFWIAVSAGIVYLFILIVKALKKYVNSKEVREEKKAVAKSLGEALKENRIRCQMTQEFVAETLCVSRQSVSTWENGFSDPNTSNLIALAKLYKISPEQLLEYAVGMPDGESNIPPYACCAPSSAAPVPVQGRPPFDFLATRTALPRLSFSTQSFYVTCFFLC